MAEVIADVIAKAPGSIAVIDYGMGNLRSVWQALVHVAEGREVVVTADPEQVAAAERVVFPGQGAMPDCMRELDARNLREVVLEAARSKPFLGICIGQQMLFEHSAEGDVAGLGVFPGVVRRFPAERMLSSQGEKLKVPHMGWNEVEQVIDHPLWHEIPNKGRFYFVHSYYIDAGNPAQVVGRGHYGKDFAAALADGSKFAVQFHPEKSHTHGLQLLQNFIGWDGRW
jgi:glutamine amidotransferase